MDNNIKEYFEQIFKFLLDKKMLVIPNGKHIDVWENTLGEWIDDNNITLFVRKGGETRGTEITTCKERRIITTDNTPAHWVFKRVELEKLTFNKTKINDLISNNKFPIAFIRKKTEYNTLLDGMVATKDTRLNEQGWKLAHIDNIAMKRGKNITIQDYKNHHKLFLSLRNMYLIDKDFSGLAEVEVFNSILRKYKEKENIK
jgi:rRNA-processing protein FCF1